MINIFYGYIKSIILFSIFISFIQVILPNSKYRSYINLVFGIILIFIMIEPLNYFLDNIKKFEILPSFNEENFKYNNDVEKYAEVRNEMILSAFKENVKRQIQVILKKEYIIKDIQINLYENKYREIIMENITLEIEKVDNKIYVRKFNETEININEKEIEHIKNEIAKNYNLNLEDVTIIFK